ncbi:polyadenylate-binding protein-interacting protein 4-like [Phalaenopsis equestris]|uniref:polyadenylate-binding protein-interacting protein 4-like n=1 Tax=Phalaenopsis equestris TaxID=78828 RepID=UPI0009E5B3A5|nr:polyadenylate-binding protein-interacting protein 4-like [Phalaenopsis equestris]XP_020584697.1 polyadenylate-binding protein-interacting protein 4-like [Phalaenopsis equestris]
MGCRNGEAETTLEMRATTSGDALLLATMCSVGRPVEVQVKDGSIYSGIFHTASLDEGYGIVLKKARMIQKGRCSNLKVGTFVDTLVVLSNDLVQVIVKDFSLLFEEDIDYSFSDRLREGIEAADSCGAGATSGNVDDNQEIKSIKSNGEADIHETHHVKKMKKSMNNDHNDLGEKDGCLCREEVEEQPDRPEVPVSEGQVGDSESHLEANSSSHIEMDSSTDTVLCEALHSSSCSKKSTTGDKSSSRPSTRPSSSVSSDGNSTISNLSTSSNLPASEGSPFCNTCKKEFKLNPEAKIFLPSFSSARSTSTVIPTIMNTSYASSLPSAMPAVAAQSSLEISSFPACAPLPAKFVQYNPLVAAQTGISNQYPQPIPGQLNVRQQATRYIGQYHPTIQTGTAYMHQNTQPVMVGRTGQLVYVHPISQDPTHGAAVLSQGFPVLTPCQANLPKLQGTQAQSLQFCMTPPLATAAPVQPFVLPSPIPFSPSVPVIRPITVPAGTGFFGSKFQ